MQRRLRVCCELPPRHSRGEASSSSTLAPASRAISAAHRAALPPPMTRTSTKLLLAGAWHDRGRVRGRLRAAVLVGGAAGLHEPVEEQEEADDGNQVDQLEPAALADVVQAARADRDARQEQRRHRDEVNELAQ